MKAKTIRKVLGKKHNDFVESIKDEEVRELVRKNSIITGGSIVSMLLNEPVNDYDYYFTNKETAFKVAHYFVEEFKKENVDYPEIEVRKEGDKRVEIFVPSEGCAGKAEETDLDPDNEDKEVEKILGFEEDTGEEEKIKYKPCFLSSNAISLTNKVQLVMRFIGEPEEIHTNYDFEHTKCYWMSKTGELVLPQKSLEAILTKELIYTGSKYPLASIFRAKKFIQRGWTINAGQYLKMAMQLNEMNLLDVETLNDQLTRVDFAYFRSLIHIIERKKEKEEDFKLSTPYVIEVIDRIF